jgi:hypothetical protein
MAKSVALIAAALLSDSIMSAPLIFDADKRAIVVELGSIAAAQYKRRSD